MLLTKKSKWIIGIFGALFLLIFCYWFGQYSKEQAVIQEGIYKAKQEQENAKNYNDALWYIEKSNFKDAASKLYQFKDGKYNGDENHKDAQVLYFYAHARYLEWEPGMPYRVQYKRANDELSKISDEYKGPFFKDVISFKTKVRDRLETYANTDKEKAKERATHV